MCAFLRNAGHDVRMVLLTVLLFASHLAYSATVLPQWTVEEGSLFRGYSTCQAALDAGQQMYCASHPGELCIPVVLEACTPGGAVATVEMGTDRVVARAYCTNPNSAYSFPDGVRACSGPTGEASLNRSQGVACPLCANPINPAVGNKVQVEIDYVGYGPFPLELRRVYNSGGMLAGGGFGRQSLVASLGYNWWHSYARSVVQITPNYGYTTTSMARMLGVRCTNC